MASASTRPRGAPSTPRGLATRAALVRAARAIFERDGFLDARISDITARARAATGSFYRYFAGKEEIFEAVVEELNAEIAHPPALDVLQEDDVLAAVARQHRAYLEAYQRNARLMSVVEQVTNVSEDFRRRRTADAQSTMRRGADAIRALQAAGRADASLDPARTARALSAMVSRSAYVTFVLEEEREIEPLADTLTRLWANALGLDR